LLLPNVDTSNSSITSSGSIPFSRAQSITASYSLFPLYSFNGPFSQTNSSNFTLFPSFNVSISSSVLTSKTDTICQSFISKGFLSLLGTTGSQSLDFL
jgi:hypothetical protein